MSLKKLFYPESVCLVGSSGIKERGNLVSPRIFRSISYNLRAFFKGKTTIADLEKTKQIPRTDLLVISLPEEITLKMIDEFDSVFCIILPGNYSHKKILIKDMKERQIRFLGPNSVCGIINTNNGLNTTFEKALMPSKGNFSIISQSGGVGASLLDLSISNFTGVDKLVWLGNGWDINFPELLRYFAEDKQTKSIGMYIEGIENGKDFIETAKKIKKPKIALKGGLSEQAAKRALSHTSSLVGSSKIYSSVFKQIGIIEVNSMNELYEIGCVLSQNKRMKGNRVAIVSNVGGPSILAADYVIRQGLELAEFSKKTTDTIKKRYPEISAINPLDLIADADAERYESCLKQVLNDKNVDAVLVINMLKSCTLKPEETRVIAKIIRKSKKPIVDCVPGLNDWEKVRRVMNRQGVYVFNDLERSVKILRAMYDYSIFC